MNSATTYDSKTIHTAECTLKQFYDWLGKREQALGNFWERVSGSRVDEIKEEARMFHVNGGHKGMTDIKFYLIESFTREYDDTDTFFLIITSLMLIPFELWEFVEIDLANCRFKINKKGEESYKRWCDDNPTKHFT